MDCVVSAVPDPIRAEEVHATIAVSSERPATEAEIVDWLAHSLSRWKLPRYVQLTDGPLPRLANGKIDRSAVVKEIDVTKSWDAVQHRAREKERGNEDD